MNADGVTHRPVMLQEALAFLEPKPGGRYIDCTVGTGGHAEAILRAAPGGRVLGIDADPDALKAARRRLDSFGDALLLVNDNFAGLAAICASSEFGLADGILFDLGLSSRQLADRRRGFSFQLDAPLDMRFSPEQKVTASDIVNGYSEGELSLLFSRYGEERHSRRVARLIAQARPISSSLELARVVAQGAGGGSRRIHPATQVFQALRIAVNGELDALEKALAHTPALLADGGRLVVISYHSLEDRLVKEFMQRESSMCLCPPEVPVCACGHKPLLTVVTRKVVRSSAAEIADNPRSRSARLRVAQRLPRETAGEVE